MINSCAIYRRPLFSYIDPKQLRIALQVGEFSLGWMLDAVDGLKPDGAITILAKRLVVHALWILRPMLAPQDTEIYLPNIKEWNGLLHSYRVPHVGRSLAQLALTLGLFTLCFAAMLMMAAHVGYWAALPLVLPTGLCVVRVFIIQHDCGHHSYFHQRWVCDWVGRGLGLLTMTPYDWWKSDHDWHHAGSGDLTRRGYGDISILTVEEYRSLPRWRRRLYRLYRHPLVLFGIGPAYQFLIRQRLPIGLRRCDRRAVLSILATDIAIAAIVVVCGLTIGFGRFFALWPPVIMVAGTVGVWLFFIQHQFEHAYWRDHEYWSVTAAALQGASYYRLPRPLEWLTASIGYHHIHHLASRIPNYRLRDCFHDIPALQQVTVIGLVDSLHCSRLALWCGERQCLLSFAEAQG